MPALDMVRQAMRRVLTEEEVIVKVYMSSGIFGEMMLTYFKRRGEASVVIDGCIRGLPKCAKA